jgi:hypothetical protein
MYKCTGLSDLAFSVSELFNRTRSGTGRSLIPTNNNIVEPRRLAEVSGAPTVVEEQRWDEAREQRKLAGVLMAARGMTAVGKEYGERAISYIAHLTYMRSPMG